MRGKSGPKPGPVKSREERKAEREAKAAATQAEKEAKAQAKAEAKAEKERVAAEEKAAKEAEKASKRAAKASPGIGHNSDLSPDQRQALFIHHLTKIEELKAEVASAAGTLRSAYKTAKADGILKKEIDFAIRLRTADEDEILEERRREQQLAQWINHPLGTQADLFGHGDGVDRTPAVDKAAEAGKLAGMEGKRCEPPHHYQTEQAQAWIESWHIGQAALIRDTIKEGPLDGGLIQRSFDDALADAEPNDDFESPVPDHANDPTSSLHPSNAG